MAASSADAGSRSRTVLLLWAVPPLVELAGLLMLYAGMPDVVADAAFGSRATPVVVWCVLAVTVAGVVVAWTGATGAVRVVTAGALFASAGVTALLGLLFATAGVLAVFTLLMAHTTVSIAMIGRAVLRRRVSEEG